MSLSHSIARQPGASQAAFGAWLRRTGLRLWQAMETAGQRRAERELKQFARQYGSQFTELASYAEPRIRA